MQLKKLGVLFLCVAAGSARANEYSLNGKLAAAMVKSLVSGGVVLKDVTEQAAQQNPQVYEALTFDAGNVLCHSSRFVPTNLGATDTFTLVSKTYGCAYNVPTDYTIGEGGMPNGTALSSDLTDVMYFIKDGVYGDAAMGKWDTGLAKLSCNLVAQKVGDKFTKTYSCSYSDWQ